MCRLTGNEEEDNMTNSELNILNTLIETVERHSQVPGWGDGWIRVDERGSSNGIEAELHRNSTMTALINTCSDELE